ncbi:MAG: zinc-finger domain-containing protein [Aaplasma endosymbiont of Hyalomma asiaticum]
MSGESDSEESVVSCYGYNDEEDDGVFSGHPKVYVRVAAGETKPCPYCGKILGKK